MGSFNPSSTILMNMRSRISSSYLRKKRRKWPLLPYKNDKWDQSFNQQLAMEALKKKAKAIAEETPQQPANDYLLSSLVDSFAAYDCEPTPCAYSFIIKTLITTTRNSSSSQFPPLHHQLTPILHRIQTVEKFHPPEQLFVYLIRLYGRAGMIHQAINLFYQIPSFRCVPTASSLNTLLSLLCKTQTQQGHLQLVPQIIFKAHSLLNIRLEESTFRLLITSLCNLNNNKIGYAVELLNQMSDHGYDPDSTLYSSILSAMCQQQQQQQSNAVHVLGFLEEMRKAGFTPNAMDYANVIRVLVKMDKGMEALGLLNQMKSDGIKPDVFCYTSILDGVISAGDFDKAEDLFEEMLVLGVVPDIYTYNVYINGLSKRGDFESAFKMLICMEELGCKPNVITYNTLIGAMCKVGKVTKALELLREMGLKCVQGNLHTYRILLDGLICKGEAIKACKFLDDMLLKGFIPRTSTVDEMICLLCELGCVSEAFHILKQMVERKGAPGATTWEKLLSSLKPSINEATSVDFENLMKDSLLKQITMALNGVFDLEQVNDEWR